jgi:hypothetical protein
MSTTHHVTYIHTSNYFIVIKNSHKICNASITTYIHECFVCGEISQFGTKNIQLKKQTKC